MRSPTRTGATSSFLGENHDDGTGVYERVRLTVTDTAGKSSTSVWWPTSG